MKKPIKAYLYKSLNNSVTHYYSIKTIPRIFEGEHIYYAANEMLPEQLHRDIENDHSNNSIIGNWNKFWKTIKISDLVNENTR